jgi:hypothetical protein
MGIAALGNSVVQLSDRDDYIGWSVDGVEAEFERRKREVRRDLPKGSVCRQVVETEYLESEEEYRTRVRDHARRLARCMMRALDEEVAIINHKGLVTKRECEKPSPKIIDRLLDVAATAEKERQKALRHSHANGNRTRRPEGGTAWRKDSESDLFRRKRAKALAETLSAKLVLQEEGVPAQPVAAIERMLKSDEGRKALRIALHANKKTKIGCNLMDIIVCGAIPPYNELLVGKLVAMLMASPQVVHEYEERYGGRPSEIASRIAGKAVIRPAELVFLGTTSLYYVGSSQYERIRIPGPGGGEITYRFLGYTEGYGSAVLSSETTDMLREVTVKTHGMRRVNNIFGEGVSPRLRMVREGLALVGIPQTVVLKHSCPRIVYGVDLAKNTREYLRGEAKEPRYIFSPQRFRKGTDEIIGFWTMRWLIPRIKREDSLRKIEAFSKEELLLSREVLEAAVGQEVFSGS